ncbi:unnamed protein product [Macrosiphum euphorbiae]|uniref:Uncharacterized protein n=1 Tax=Macrosiphum euphorbiae TaxID=13131 RepID=A0AAV0WQE7_9HEMI|nr:unnamed protein product [Macrosiphum euphorbiae]
MQSFVVDGQTTVPITTLSYTYAYDNVRTVVLIRMCGLHFCPQPQGSHLDADEQHDDKRTPCSNIWRSDRCPAIPWPTSL